MTMKNTTIKTKIGGVDLSAELTDMMKEWETDMIGVDMPDPGNLFGSENLVKK